eukprot:COSAG03_NODE_2394_length_2814_cov_15.603315_4_plen_350_part_00
MSRRRVHWPPRGWPHGQCQWGHHYPYPGEATSVYPFLLRILCIASLIYICLSVCLPACLSTYLPVCLSVSLSVCLSLWVSLCLSLSVCVTLYVLRCRYGTWPNLTMWNCWSGSFCSTAFYWMISGLLSLSLSVCLFLSPSLSLPLSLSPTSLSLCLSLSPPPPLSLPLPPSLPPPPPPFPPLPPPPPPPPLSWLLLLDRVPSGGLRRPRRGRPAHRANGQASSLADSGINRRQRDENKRVAWVEWRRQGGGGEGGREGGRERGGERNVCIRNAYHVHARLIMEAGDSESVAKSLFLNAQRAHWNHPCAPRRMLNTTATTSALTPDTTAQIVRGSSSCVSLCTAAGLRAA